MSIYEVLGLRSHLGGVIKLTGTTYALYDQEDSELPLSEIKLQKGNPNDPEIGLNGFSVEDLIQIAEDRLRTLNGEVGDPNNNSAMLALNTALLHLKQRDRNRKRTGVSGTSEAIPETSRKVELIQPSAPPVKKRAKPKK